MAFVCSSYEEEKLVSEDGKEDVRTVMHLHPALAPVKAAVLPLSKKLAPLASDIYCQLAKSFDVQYDEAGSIGKRYRRQDSIGTPVCITVDFDSEANQTVTVRDRDSMKQQVVKIADLNSYIENLIKF